MPRQRRQDDRLYWWKIAAGLLSAVYLAGLLMTALLHETVGTYAPVVGVFLVGTLVMVVVSVARRFRAWLHRPPEWSGPLEDRVESVARTAGVAAVGALVARRTLRKDRS